MSKMTDYTYGSHCPICDGLLEMDEVVGYVCPDCGWDASFELDKDEVWIVPDDRGKEVRPQ